MFRAPDNFGPVQLVPPGLLGFLNLKSSGDNPHSILAEYRPAIEMRDWLLQARQEDINFTNNVLVTGNLGTRLFLNNAPIVPQGEWWFVHNVAMFTGLLPAGDIIGGAIDWVVGNPANYAVHIVGNQQTFTGAANRVALWRSDRGFFMPPGAQLGLYVTDAVFAVNGNPAGWAQITRLPA